MLKEWKVTLNTIWFNIFYFINLKNLTPPNREVIGLKLRLVSILNSQISFISTVSDLLHKRQKLKYPGINLEYLWIGSLKFLLLCLPTVIYPISHLDIYQVVNDGEKMILKSIHSNNFEKISYFKVFRWREVKIIEKKQQLI